MVEEEHDPLCHEIYDRNVRRLLFEVTYFGCRINLEIYHSLADGTGALHFLRLLVYHYLLGKHPVDPPPPAPYEASRLQGADDSFERYYEKNKQKVREEKPRAYRFKGQKVAENRIRLVEGRMPVRAVIEKAHEYDATLTSFMTAALICAISDVMSVRDKSRPVVITLPVNLRQYFFSESSRNFFSVFEVSHDFSKQGGAFSDVVAHVTESFRRELTAERMRLRMNKLAAIEHNVFARAVPRVLKDPVLRAANKITDRGITAALSNIGRVDMPAELAGYIRRFDVFTSTERLQICMCSYGGELVVSFTSAFESMEVQKNFFRFLAELGVPVTIVTPPDGDAE